MELFVNDLTVIDCSLLCPERGLLGESWLVDLVLAGGLDQQSMILDFGEVKRRIKQLIDEWVDHRLLVPSQASSVHVEPEGERCWVHQRGPGQQRLHVHAPVSSFALIPSPRISAEAVARYLEQQILPALPGNIERLSFNLRPEHIDEPHYQYSHGLKKHDGNCQRIAHGHRSRIRVYVDERLDKDLQQYWAERWRDIYLVSEEDVVEVSALSAKARSLWQSNLLATRYTSDQGLFEMLIDAGRCDVIPSDTTVECLARFMATESARQRPDQAIRIQAFEGVGKGAIAYHP